MDISILKKIPFQQYPWFLNVQLINILVPLISYPYLVRVVGPEKFGLIALAGSLGAIITTISEYGSSFTGVRDISRLSDDEIKLSEYFSTSLVVRGLLFTLCFSFIFLAQLFVKILKEEMLLFFLTIVTFLPSAIVPVWLFTGLHKIRSYNLYLVGSKVLGLVILFIVIQHESDYKVYPVIQLFPAIINGCIFLFSMKTLGLHFRKIRLENLKIYFREGYYPFIAQSITSLYTQMNPIVLMGLVKDPIYVGYYALAEKIVLLAKSILSPVNQLFLPIISRRFFEYPMEAIKESLSFSIVVGIINAIAVLLLMAGAPIAVAAIGGPNFVQSVSVVQMLSPIVLFIAVNNVFGVHILLNMELKKQFFIGIMIGLITNVGMLCLLVPLLSYGGPALSWSFAELAVLLYYVLRVRKSILKK